MLIVHNFESPVCRPPPGNDLKLVFSIVLFISSKQLFVLIRNSTKAHESLTFKLIGFSEASPLCISSFAEKIQAYKIFSASGMREVLLSGEKKKKRENSPVRNFSVDAMLYCFI